MITAPTIATSNSTEAISTGSYSPVEGEADGLSIAGDFRV